MTLGSQKQSVDQIVIKAVKDVIAQQGFVVPGDSEADQELHN